MVSTTGARSWILRYMHHGKARWLGLGSLRLIGLAEARKSAQAAQRQLLDGVDPLEARHAQARARAARAVTFKAAAEAYIIANKAAWRSPKSEAQWRASLTAYAFEAIGNLPVADVSPTDVLRVLDPIWREKAETAARVRSRIELILDYAKGRGWRDGENPARWRGNLASLLPARRKVTTVKHHAALDWREVPAFMQTLRADNSLTSFALQFLILTATRSGEALGAVWGEIDRANALWVVPSQRMKSHREHRVPLSAAAVGVLARAQQRHVSDDPAAFVFPGRDPGRPPALSTLQLLLRGMRAGVTLHGFRSTFRDWAAETGQREDIAEAALAHVRGDKTHGAYQRGDLLERRRMLMRQWSEFLAEPRTTGEVIPLHRQAKP